MKKKAWIAVAWALILVAGAAALFFSTRGRRLVLSDTETGAVIASYPIKYGDRFSIGFIHSVNQSPVIDVYEVREDGIYAVETIYENFGAGVETQLQPGEELHYDAEGRMIVSGINAKREALNYIVGTVSDHVLCLHCDNENTAEEISLRELCGRNAHVTFQCQ